MAMSKGDARWISHASVHRSVLTGSSERPRAWERRCPESMNQQQLENTALITSQDRETSWRPILHASNQVVLYNPTSHALTIHHSSHASAFKRSVPRLCPYCSQPLPTGFKEHDGGVHAHEKDSLFSNLNRFEDVSGPRASNYFQLLQVANDSASRPPSPRLHPTQSALPSQANTRSPSPAGIDSDNVFTPESMAEGYFKAFFQEEARLGMGANGSVFLCQVQPKNSNRSLPKLISKWLSMEACSQWQPSR